MITLTDFYHVRKALERHEHLHGRDRLPAGFLAIVDGLRALDQDIAGHLETLADTSSADVDGITDDDVVSYSHVATALGVTNRTISRYVKSGKLDRIGRKVTRASLHELLEEGE